jgi:hypothetical protein
VGARNSGVIRTRLMATVLAVGFGGAGCKCIMASTGDMMANYTVEDLNPFMIQFGDVGMACELGQSVGGQLLSFERLGVKADLAGVATMASAATCADMEGWGHELRGARAARRGDGAEAKDARIAEKRSHYVAAWRYQKAYEYLVVALGEPGGKCPDFDNDKEQLAWLVGSIAGVQAVQHDRATGGQVGVPLDVPRKIARGIHCVNNEHWWGVPAALEAAVWTAIPGAAPEGADPWKQMAEASALGRSSGVRVAMAIRAQAAVAAGRTDEVRAAIRDFAAAGEATQVPKKWRLLDMQSAGQLLALSDRLWTEATGHRTPDGAFGTFWDDVEEAVEDDDMLDDLGDEPASSAPEQQAPAAPAGNG